MAMDESEKALKEKYKRQKQITELYINELETTSAEELQKEIDRIKAEELRKAKPPYIRVKSKIWKGKLAPQGKLFMGVKVKKATATYTNVLLVDCNGKQDHLEELFYANMYLLLNEKYKFDKDISAVESYKQDIEAQANKFSEK